MNKTNSTNKKTYRNNSKISTVWIRLKVKRSLEKRLQHNLVCIYLFKKSAIETEEKHEKSVSKLTIESHIVEFDVFIVNFEHISAHFSVVFIVDFE